MGKFMKIFKTKLDSVYIVEPNVFPDERGELVKTFPKDTFIENKMDYAFVESYYSVSHKNVIRGMHFQVPPADHTKLVYVTNGAILDVILDIRAGSPTYGQHISVELSGKNHKMVYIPSGFAHGFLSLEDNSCVTYLQTSIHSPEHDQGIKADSFGMSWGVKNPTLSKRDQGFPSLAQFKTPFIFE